MSAGPHRFGASGIKDKDKAKDMPGKKTATTKADEGDGSDADEVGNAVVIKNDGSVHISGDAVNVNKAKGFTAKQSLAQLRRQVGYGDAQGARSGFERHL